MNPDSKQKRIAFGYKRNAHNEIEIYEGQAAVVKMIYIQYLSGHGLRAIKEMLEGLGVPSPNNRKSWGIQAISNILSNPHYTGDEVYPQIITPENFEKAQGIKATKSTHHN